MNRVILMGNITRKPEIRKTPSGASVCNFSIAVSEKYKDKQGQWVDKAEFINCVAWNRTAEVIEQYLDKGSKILVEGKMSTSSYDKNGEKRYKTEVIVSNMQMLGGKSDNQATQQAPAPSQAPSYDAPSYQDDSLPF